MAAEERDPCVYAWPPGDELPMKVRCEKDHDHGDGQLARPEEGG